MPALAPPAAGVAEDTLEGAAAKGSRQALEARPPHLADVAFDDEQAEQHDQEADDTECEDAGERRDQEDEAGANRWTTEYRKTDGKLMRTDTWELSADGKTLSLTSSGARPNGDLYTDTEEYERTAGTSGLIGSWKGTNVKLSSPSELTLEVTGLDSMTLKIAALKATCVAKFDGKDTAVEGPDIPPGFRLALTRTGPYSFKLVQKLNGSQISSSEYKVSEDGKTMTEIGNAPGDSPSTTVWEKQ